MNTGIVAARYAKALLYFATQNGEAELVYACLLYTISEPTRQAEISYDVFCLKKKKKFTYFYY